MAESKDTKPKVEKKASEKKYTKNVSVIDAKDYKAKK